MTVVRIRKFVTALGLLAALGCLLDSFPKPSYAAASCSSPSFTKAPTFSEDFVNYRAVTFAEFNGDGKTDMAVASVGSGGAGPVRVYLNDGSGGFGPPASFQTGDPNGTGDIAAADFNKDGKQDLVTAGSFNNNVSLLLGNGSGGFAANVDFGVGSGPRAITVADFNRDGNPDVATANFFGTASVLLGNGAGSFAAVRNFNVPSNARFLKAGDFNNDSKPDIVVSSETTNGVTVLLGDGAGDFAPASASFGVFNRTTLGLDVGDFDKDGALDLAVVNSSGPPEVVIWRGDGAGHFAVQSTILAGFGARFILASDFDADGQLDLFVTNADALTGSVMRGLGGGSFAPQRRFAVGIQSPVYAAAGDINGDGKQDVGVVDVVEVSTLVGDGAGGFLAPEAFPVSSNSFTAAISVAEGDYNLDGKVDLAVALDNGVTTLLNDGAGKFQSKFSGPVATSGPNGSIAAADFNRDGKLDVATTAGAGATSVSAFLGDGTGGFTRRSVTQADTSPLSLYVADFNNDGIDDLVTPTFGGNSASILLGDGTGAFTRKAVAGFGSQVRVIAVADFNGDGKADLVGRKPNVNPSFNDVAVFLGDGEGNFSQSPNAAFPTFDSPLALLTDDLNGDGKADLLVSVSTPLSSAAGIFFLPGDGAGGLGAPTTVSSTTVATSLVSGDFNADGAADIAGSAGNTAFVMLGDGAGNFGQPSRFPVGLSPRKVVAADLNGDGKTDLATANASGDVTVLINTYSFAPEPLPSLTVGDATVTEGDAGAASMTFNVQLSAASARTVAVSFYAFPTGTAAAVGDFQPVAGSVVFAPGATSRTINVPVTGDTLDEFDEKFAVRLAFPLNAVVARGQAEGAIADDDPPPSASVADVNVNEANSGPGAAAFTVTLSAASGKPVTISYATADGSAAAGVDYQAVNGTLTFNPGETSKTVAVGVAGDTTFETDETFFVNLSNPVNVTLTRAQGSGLIVNDDPLPAASVADASKAEGDAGTSDLMFTVTLSNASYQPASVTYATFDGAATSPADFQAVTGTLTFAPGETSRTFAVPLVGDTAVENSETFSATISNPVGATLADSHAFGTIVEDDTSVHFTITVTTLDEDDGGVQLVVTRDGVNTGVTTVNYSTSDGTASERSDYNLTLGTLRFAPGETSKSFTVLVTDDRLAEGDESFNVALSAPTGATLDSPSTLEITVADNDGASGPSPVRWDASFDSSFFVRQHYRDFLNREPDASGLAFWIDQTTNCGNPNVEVCRVNVSAAFFLSIEFQQTGYLVYKTYKAAYGDLAPDKPVPVRLREFTADTQEIGRGVQVGAGGWEARLENNKRAYFDAFVTTQRFAARYPDSLTASQFVNMLNANAGGVLSQSEMDGLAADLSSGAKTRAQVLRALAENATLHQRERNKAFVLMEYFGYLRRNPDDPPQANLDFDGFNFWLAKLNQANGNFVAAEMVKAFLTADEYKNRFGQ
jgi:hypothetical protein